MFNLWSTEDVYADDKSPKTFDRRHIKVLWRYVRLFANIDNEERWKVSICLSPPPPKRIVSFLNMHCIITQYKIDLMTKLNVFVCLNIIIVVNVKVFFKELLFLIESLFCSNYLAPSIIRQVIYSESHSNPALLPRVLFELDWIYPSLS